MLSLPITAGDNFDVANLTETPHRMSALGHKRTFCDAGAMSALPPKADIGWPAPSLTRRTSSSPRDDAWTSVA